MAAEPRVLVTKLSEITDLSGTAANIKFVTVDLNEASEANQTKVTPLTLLDTRFQATATALLIANDLSDLNDAGTARTNLGLGTIATQDANNVSISGGSVIGITDITIADGGTGQSTAQAAIDALTAVSGATDEHVLTKDTATGNAIFKAAAGGSSLPVVDETAIVFKTGTPANTLTFDVDAYTAARVVTLPDAALTVAGLEVAQTFTAVQAVIDDNAATNAIVNVQTIGLNSTGTAAAGFGPGLLFTAESSTTVDQSAGRLTYEWGTATHATRAATGILSAYYTSTEREIITWTANSTNATAQINAETTIRNYAQTFTSGTHSGVDSYFYHTPSGNSSASVYSVRARVETGGANTLVGVIGVSGICQHFGSNTLGTSYGMFFDVKNFSTGTITNAVGAYVKITNINASGTIVTAVGIQVDSVSNAGTVNTNYGILINDQSAATINYAIYTSVGDVRLMASATDKMGLWGLTPVVQPATTGTTTGFTAGSGTAANDDSTFTGNTGASAYTIGDIVLALKQVGLLAA